MTNKTELVLVPRELFEAVAYFDKGRRTVGELQLWAKDVLMRHDNPIKTTAEDVRAVVDEPAAWEIEWSGTGESYGLTHSQQRADKLSADQNFEVFPLYRHPQRQVVLPERVDPEYFDSIRATGTGWNACIDEFYRLNPEITK